MRANNVGLQSGDLAISGRDFPADWRARTTRSTDVPLCQVSSTRRAMLVPGTLAVHAVFYLTTIAVAVRRQRQALTHGSLNGIRWGVAIRRIPDISMDVAASSQGEVAGSFF
jgi:hypothetical protein